MKTYIGTKIIQAEPESRVRMGDIHETPGYRVVYSDGYTSWCPVAAFEEAYRETSGMPFGLAIEAMKKGCRVARAGWNGKGMWLAMQPGSVITPAQARGGAAKGRADEGAAEIVILPHIDMRAADGSVVVGWLASQTDMLSDDWQVVGELESFRV
jgi:hypothetical protein